MTVCKFYPNTWAGFCEFEARLLDIANYRPDRAI